MADPNFDSIADSFEALKANFLPNMAQGVNKTIQFDFTGREEGTWNMTVENGAFSYGQGPASNPSATVKVDSDNWLSILSGAMDPVSAFMGGKIQIAGDMGVMMQFQNWFKRP
jgi:putative sterol carrier protein